MPLIYPKNVNKKYDLGIIPHFVDKDSEVVNKWEQSQGSKNIIDTLDTPEQVIYKIKQCRNIISSSLHGLIIAETYGIPSAWFVMPQETRNKNYSFYKYLDHYSALGIEIEPYIATGAETIKQLIDITTLKPKKEIDTCISNLDACMKQLRKSIKSRHS